MDTPVENYLILAAVLFGIGGLGVLIRRNVIVILMSIELMLNAVNLTFVAGISVAFLVILTWAIRKDRKEGVRGDRGPMASRALQAALTATGMANLAIILIFAVGAFRDGDFAVWLYYPAVVFLLQSAAWYVAWSLKKKGWMLATAAGGWLTAVALGLLVREPILYLGVCTAALFLLFAGPGWIMVGEARKAGA